MQTYRKLLRWYFRWTWFCLALPAAALLVANFLAVSIYNNSTDYTPYAALVTESFSLWFTIALGGAVIWFCLWCDRFYRKSPRAAYTMLTLPGPARTPAAARATVGGIYALTLVALQNLYIIVLYPLYRHNVHLLIHRLHDTQAQTPGALSALDWPHELYLTFARSPLLHLTLPATAFSALLLLLLLISCALVCTGRDFMRGSGISFALLLGFACYLTYDMLQSQPTKFMRIFCIVAWLLVIVFSRSLWGLLRSEKPQPPTPLP